MESYVDIDSEGFSTKELADIQQCLETLFSIRAGSQPLDRELGIDYEEIVGYPLDVAQNKLSVEIVEKVQRYEPRVEVDSVTFDGNTDGQLIPYVHLIKSEDYEAESEDEDEEE